MLLRKFSANNDNDGSACIIHSRLEHAISSGNIAQILRLCISKKLSVFCINSCLVLWFSSQFLENEGKKGRDGGREGGGEEGERGGRGERRDSLTCSICLGVLAARSCLIRSSGV